MRSFRIVAAMLVLSAVLGFSQERSGSPVSQAPGNEQPRGRRGPGTAGTITAIDDGGITMKTRDGETVQVSTTAGTEFRKNCRTAKLTDFKVGDEIFVVGDQKRALCRQRWWASVQPKNQAPIFVRL